jgi:CheY-like chemotaxis protein
MTGDRDRCLSAGMNDYLSKPIDAAALAEVIGKYSG